MKVGDTWPLSCLFSPLSRAAPKAARISGLITQRRRLHHIRNSIAEDRSLTAIRAAQDLVIDNDLVLGFLQCESAPNRDPAPAKVTTLIRCRESAEQEGPDWRR